MALPASLGHPTVGGKSLDNLPVNPYASHPSADEHQAQAHEQRTPYKSWRKKYRKMRAIFDEVLEENKKLFKEEMKLEGIAKRLREELDGILDICLDLNENPSLPPELRFNVTPPDFHRDAAIQVDADITPENANQTVHEYKLAVQAGTIPQMDIYIIRSEVERVLAAQESRPLDEVLATLPTRPVSGVDKDALPEEIRGDDPPGLLSTERETERLLRLDAQLGDPVSIKRLAESTGRLGSQFEEEKHPASMTPRELERHVELLNPQSQHSWLKAHHKLGPEINDNDAESLASHETGAKAARKRSKNLAKQLGDRALERASAMESGDEDSMVEDLLGAGSERRKKGGRREDGSYHPKMGMGGAAGGGGGKKGKRKRSEGGEGAAGGGKKARVEGGVLE